MTKSVGPTLTMAQLYEQQNQLFDALAVYESLEEAQADPEVRDRIDRLQDRIMKQKNYSYSQLTKRVFSREELERFRIIPGNDFAAYEESLRNAAMAHENEYPEELEIEEDDALTIVRDENETPEPLPVEPEPETLPEPEPEPEPVLAAPEIPPEPEPVVEEIPHAEPEIPVAVETRFIAASTAAWRTLTIGELTARLIQNLDPSKRLEDLTLREITELLDS
jgi:hypothetical protein